MQIGNPIKITASKFIAILMAIALIMIGCHSIPPASETAVTIKLASWGSSPIEQNLLKQILQDFQKDYPEIKVKHEIIADQYMDVLKTRLIGEAAADVFYLDALEAPLLMNHEVLEPLDSYITPEFQLSDFEPRLLDAFKFKNTLYGIPKDYTTLALLYNKKAFAEVGLTDPPQTWEELKRYAKLLTRDRNNDGKFDQYGIGISPELARQAYKIQAYGGQLIDENGYAAFATPQGIAGLQPLIDLYRQDNSAVLPSDVGTNSGSEMFGQEKVAMVIEGSWAIPYLLEIFPQLKFATAELPKLNNKSGTMAYTVAYVMNQKTIHKSEAWQLIAYLTDPETMLKWTSSGFALPTRQSVTQRLGEDQNSLHQPFIAGVAYATLWQAGEHLSTIMNHFNNQFLSAILGDQPLQKALLKAQQAANQQIQQKR